MAQMAKLVGFAAKEINMAERPLERWKRIKAKREEEARANNYFGPYWGLSPSQMAFEIAQGKATCESINKSLHDMLIYRGFTCEPSIRDPKMNIYQRQVPEPDGRWFVVTKRIETKKDGSPKIHLGYKLGGIPTGARIMARMCKRIDSGEYNPKALSPSHKGFKLNRWNTTEDSEAITLVEKTLNTRNPKIGLRALRKGGS